jgi:hypothetical protein
MSLRSAAFEPYGGTHAYLVAVACVPAGIVVAGLFARATRWPLVRRFLIELARYDRRGTRHEDPFGGELLRYGRILGRADKREWNPEELARRVKRIRLLELAVEHRS